MTIILHKGDPIKGVYKIKIWWHDSTSKNPFQTPYIEHRTRVKGQKDPKACIIGTEPLSNVKKIKDK